MKSWLKHPRKTECDNVREWLSPYLDGELDSDERQRVASHLESCQACREEYASLQKTVSLVQRIPVIEPRRPFAISEAVKETWDRNLKVLTASTILVAVAGAIIFLGDIWRLFDQTSDPSAPWQQQPNFGFVGNTYTWPIRETEFGLLFIFVILAVITIVYWRRRVRKLRRRK